MPVSQIIEFAQQALLLVLFLSLPAVAAAALVGVFVGVFQAATQIQDQSIGQAAKFIAVAVALALSITWVATETFNFGASVIQAVADIGVRSR
jgi:type III secretion protein S